MMATASSIGRFDVPVKSQSFHPGARSNAVVYDDRPKKLSQDDLKAWLERPRPREPRAVGQSSATTDDLKAWLERPKPRNRSSGSKAAGKARATTPLSTSAAASTAGNSETVVARNGSKSRRRRGDDPPTSSSSPRADPSSGRCDCGRGCSSCGDRGRGSSASNGGKGSSGGGGNGGSKGSGRDRAKGGMDPPDTSPVTQDDYFRRSSHTEAARERRRSMERSSGSLNASQDLEKLVEKEGKKNRRVGVSRKKSEVGSKSEGESEKNYWDVPSFDVLAFEEINRNNTDDEFLRSHLKDNDGGVSASVLSASNEISPLSKSKRKVGMRSSLKTSILTPLISIGKSLYHEEDDDCDDDDDDDLRSKASQRSKASRGSVISRKLSKGKKKSSYDQDDEDFDDEDATSRVSAKSRVSQGSAHTSSSVFTTNIVKIRGYLKNRHSTPLPPKEMKEKDKRDRSKQQSKSKGDKKKSNRADDSLRSYTKEDPARPKGESKRSKSSRQKSSSKSTAYSDSPTTTRTVTTIGTGSTSVSPFTRSLSTSSHGAKGKERVEVAVQQLPRLPSTGASEDKPPARSLQTSTHSMRSAASTHAMEGEALTPTTPVGAFELSQEEAPTSVYPSRVKTRKPSASPVTQKVNDLPWSDPSSEGKLHGQYTGPVDELLRPHGEGSLVLQGNSFLKFYGRWVSGVLVTPLMNEDERRDHRAGYTSSAGRNMGRGRSLNERKKRPIVDHTLSELRPTIIDHTKKSPKVQKEKRRMSVSSTLTPDPASLPSASSPCTPSSASPGGKKKSSRSKEGPGKQRKKYELGEVARTPRDMVIHRENERAIEAAAGLKKYEQAFLKRSNGLWTCSVMADRGMQPTSASSSRWYAKYEIDEDGQTELEESMLFVINEDGATKIVKRRHWGKYVRCMQREDSERESDV